MKNNFYAEFDTYDYKGMGDEGLNPYAVQKIIKRHGSKMSFEELRFCLSEQCHEYMVKPSELIDTLQLLHDYGFGVVFDGKNVRYDAQLDYAA